MYTRVNNDIIIANVNIDINNKNISTF